MTVDFKNLSVTDAELPAVKREGSSAPAVTNTPFPGWLRESYESGKGKSITIPADAVAEAVYLIRQSANHENIGSRIVLQDRKGERVDLKTEKVTKDGKDVRVSRVVRKDADGKEHAVGGNVTVMFQGKERKQSRKGKDTTGDATAAEGTAPATA